MRISFWALIAGSSALLLSSPALGLAEPPDLKSLSGKIDKGKPAERVKAIQEAGELGHKGQPVLRNLAMAMMAKEKDVRVAAATAMKQIDSRVTELAVKLLVNPADVNFEEVLKEDKAEVEPLVPIFVFQYESLTNQRAPSEDTLKKAQLILNCIFTCAPDDPLSSSTILKALKSNSINLQHTGVVGARVVKDGKAGITDVLRIAKRCPNEGIRLDAIRTATELCDAENKAVISKGLGEIQFDKSEVVRKAVDKALEQIKDK